MNSEPRSRSIKMVRDSIIGEAERLLFDILINDSSQGRLIQRDPDTGEISIVQKADLRDKVHTLQSRQDLLSNTLKELHQLIVNDAKYDKKDFEHILKRLEQLEAKLAPEEVEVNDNCEECGVGPIDFCGPCRRLADREKRISEAPSSHTGQVVIPTREAINDHELIYDHGRMGGYVKMLERFLILHGLNSYLRITIEEIDSESIPE